MGMGTGKTKVFIDWAAAIATKNHPRAPRACALVVCPLGVVGVWHKEIPIHDPFADNEYMGVDWRIVNYDKIWRPHVYDEIVEWLEQYDFNDRIVICDESHKIKKHSTRRSKAMHRLAAHAAHRAIGSGTAFPHSPLDAFSQYKFVDVSIFGSRFAPFKRLHAIYKWNSPIIYKYRNEARIARKIAPITFQIEREECIDLPARMHRVIPVKLTGQNQEVYDQLARDSVVEFKDETIEVPHVLTQIMRLQQVTGGWIKGKNSYRRVGHDKLNAYTELLEKLHEHDRKKVVVFVRFKRELMDLIKATRKVGYSVLTVHGGNRNKRERVYSAFESTERDCVLICQIQTGALGRNELVVASEAIFYSCDFSFDNFDQALDRLHRPGQKRKVTYFHLLAEGTVDRAVLLSHKTKRDLANLVLKHPALVYNQHSNSNSEEG